MVNKQRKMQKINVSKNEHHIRGHNEFVNILKHFNSEGHVSKLIRCELPKKTFDFNKADIYTTENKEPNPKERSIKISNVSECSTQTTRNVCIMESTNEQANMSSSTLIQETSSKIKYSSLPAKYHHQLQYNNNDVNVYKLMRKYSNTEDEELNTPTKSSIVIKSNESNNTSNSSSFSVKDNDEIKSKGGKIVYQHIITGDYEHNSSEDETSKRRFRSPILISQGSDSKSSTEVADKKVGIRQPLCDKPISTNKNRQYELIEEIRNEKMKNKRRHIAELKTEIAEFRDNKGTRNKYKSPLNGRSYCHKHSTPDQMKGSVQSLRTHRPVKSEQLEPEFQRLQTSEEETAVTEDEPPSTSGSSNYENQIGNPFIQDLATKNQDGVDTELNTKIEQNKLLIDKVQNILNIIKLGVQFPAKQSDESLKLEENTPDVILREVNSEEEDTAVHIYDKSNDQIRSRESNSYINLNAGTSWYDFGKDTMRMKVAKSDVETAIRNVTVEGTTSEASEDTLNSYVSEVCAMTDVEIMTLEEQKDIQHNRPLTRRREENKWLEDKFRTEPISVRKHPGESSDNDVLEAEFNTEPEIGVKDVVKEHSTEDIHTSNNGSTSEPELLETNIKQSVSGTSEQLQNIEICKSPEDIEKPSVEQKISDKNSASVGIREDLQPKSVILDKNSETKLVPNVGDNCGRIDRKIDARKEFAFKSKLRQTNPVSITAAKYTRSHNNLKDAFTKKTSNNCSIFTTNNHYTEKTVAEDNSKEDKRITPIIGNTCRSKDLLTNTETFIRHTEIATTTEGLRIIKDTGSNTVKDYTSKDIATNTIYPDTLVHKASSTHNINESKTVASNTINQCNDVALNVKPQQKHFGCKAKLTKHCKDAFCDTYGLKTTSDTSCSVDIPKVPVATQKYSIDPKNMRSENVGKTDIPSRQILKKSETLRFQLLPPINIGNPPAIQRVLHINIDQNGQSHVSHKASPNNVGYIEVQSPSILKFDGMEAAPINITRTNYTSGQQRFQEIEKKATTKTIKTSKQKFSYFIDHHVDQERASSCDARMLKNTITVPSKSERPVLPVYHGNGVLVKKKKVHQAKICNLDPWSYFRKNDSYLKRTQSDSSLVVEAIKEISANTFASNSDTNSQAISTVKWKQIYCSNKNIYSTENSSQVVGDFVSNTLDENIYKTFIDPEGFSRNSSQSRYPIRKIRRNLEYFTQHGSSRNSRKRKPLCKDFQTQTSLPNRISTTAIHNRSDNKENSELNKYSPKSANTDHITSQVPMKSPLVPLELASNSSIIMADKMMVDPIKSQLSDSMSVRKQDESPISTRAQNKLAEVTHCSSDTSIIKGNPSQINEFTSLLPNKQGTSWEKISLTITCSTDEENTPINDSTGTSTYVSVPCVKVEKLNSRKSSITKPPRTLQDDRDESGSRLNKVPSTKQGATKSSNIKCGKNDKECLKDCKADGTEMKPIEYIYKKDNFKTKNGVRIKKEENRKKWKNSRKEDDKNLRSKDDTLVDAMPICGDSRLVGKDKKGPAEKSKQHMTDILAKFRNIYLSDNYQLSETTREGSYSEGEIKCNCDTSSGEIHACKRYQPHSKIHSFPKDIGVTPIKKRRHYLNNWITYYFNKNSLLNNSSSTSYN